MELEGYLNGRSSSSFTSSDQNVAAVLDKGTRGEILEYKKLQSGNYGLRIKVLSGTNKGQYFWVYHRVNDSDLALYETAPQDWSQGSRATASVEKARGVETTRDVQGLRPRPAAPSYSSVKSAFSAIEQSNNRLSEKRQETCATCSLPAAGQSSIVRKATSRGMSRTCSNLMSSQGELGSQGQSVFSIMAEAQYASYFTARNALGNFCPKFNTLTNTQKLQAWTWFWTALAMEEASCEVTKVHGTTYVDRKGNVRILNPREGYGMWALERDRNIRRGRGAACDNIANASGQARCAIDIMTKRQLSRGRTASSDSGSYWGPIRRGNSQIMPHMRRLTLCF